VSGVISAGVACADEMTAEEFPAEEEPDASVSLETGENELQDTSSKRMQKPVIYFIFLNIRHMPAS
jgi:hypothetical protein